MSSTANGTTTLFAGDASASPCYGQDPDPRRDATVFYGASLAGNQTLLSALEPGLRCVEDTSFLCVGAIMRGITQTRTTADTIFRASAIRPGDLFQRLGTKRCAIPVGSGSATHRNPLPGRCTVTVQGLERLSSAPTVTFTETWPRASGGTASHTWQVFLQRAKTKIETQLVYAVARVTEYGAKPPQHWP